VKNEGDKERQRLRKSKINRKNREKLLTEESETYKERQM
jgi:hypothetical protein